MRAAPIGTGWLVILLGGWAGAAAWANEPPGRGAPAESAGAAQRASAPAEDPWASPEIAAPHMDDPPVRRPGAARGAPRSSAERVTNSTGAAWLRTTGALAGVIALILLLAWGYRAVTSGAGLGRGPRASAAVAVEILGRAALSARQSVCVVRVGARLVLVGVSPERLTCLDVIADADTAARVAGQAAAARPSSVTRAFAESLESEQSEYADGPGAAAPSVRNAAADRLAGTLRRLRALSAAS